MKSEQLKRLGLAVGIVLLVALPRLTNLSGYLIVDEADRWRWAEAFYRALIAGDLRAMLVGDGYPGIVPVWLETIWLLGESLRRSVLEGRWFGEEGVYVLFHVWSRTTYLVQQRLPIVLFNSLLALLIAWYTTKVYGRRVGLVALVLIALNPFYLADSRVNRAEAIITGLLTLSILFLLRYGQTRQYRWLIVSGFVGGFSFLTKIQGVVVLLPLGIILLFFQFTREIEGGDGGKGSLPSRLLFTIRDGLLWALTAVLIWVIFWPAMWVRPLDVLTLVFDYTTRKAGSEGVNLFFMGRHFYNEDPGLLFYPVVALMRMTPLTMLGLALAAWKAIHTPWPAGHLPCLHLGRRHRWRTAQPALRQSGGGQDGLTASPACPAAVRRGAGLAKTLGGWAATQRAVVPLLIYIVLYAGTMTLGSHKQDRYLMPIFLALDILAAMGWVYLWEQLGERWHGLRAGHWTSVAFAGLLLVQTVSVLPYHPYYFPYFNPLLGGGRLGARTLRVGWGEGMDLVADYLNAKPNASSLTVAARWYRYMFDFVGRTLPFDETGRWTQADYMVLYIQQTQRMLHPSPGVIRYFQARQPEHVIRINGVEYAQIYPSPFTRPSQPWVSVIPERAALFGYRWEDPQSAGVGMEQLKVIWENQGLTQAPQLVAALTDGDADPTWYPCQVASGFETAARTPGEVVESACDLSRVADELPTGAFDLRFALADDAGNVDAFLFPQGWRSMVKEEGGSWRPAEWLESLDQVVQDQVPSIAIPVDIYYRGQIRLVAYELSSAALQPGQPLTITLYWQALTPIEEDYIVFNHLFGLDGMTIGEADEGPAVPTSRWLPGQVITSTHHMLTEPGLPTPAVATLDVGLYDAERKALITTDRRGQLIPVTVTRTKFVPAIWPDQPPPIVDDALFGDSLLLKGHSALPELMSPQGDETFTLQLWWQSLAPLDTDYTVFIHVLDAAGTIVAQADGVPMDGRYPTSAWEPGEQIVDSRLITLPADLAGGEHRLIIGLYNPADGSRLPLAGHDTDSALLGQITVNP